MGFGIKGTVARSFSLKNEGQNSECLLMYKM